MWNTSMTLWSLGRIKSSQMILSTWRRGWRAVSHSTQDALGKWNKTLKWPTFFCAITKRTTEMFQLCSVVVFCFFPCFFLFLFYSFFLVAFWLDWFVPNTSLAWFEWYKHLSLNICPCISRLSVNQLHTRFRWSKLEIVYFIISIKSDTNVREQQEVEQL